VFNYLKQLTQHSTIYGISNILNKTLAIFLIPIYTHYLDVAEYGNLELFLVTLNFLVLFLPLGLNVAIFAFTISLEKNDPRDVISTVFNFTLIFTGVVVCLIYYFSPVLSQIISDDPQRAYFLRIITINACMSVILLIPLARLRVENRSVTYSILNTIKFGSNLLLNIYFVVYIKKGIEGILLAGLYSSVITTILSLSFIHRDILLFKISRKLLTPMLKFGIPLVPSAIASAILTMANRFFLEKLSTSEELGLFTLGFKFASIITFLTMAFQVAWPTFLFTIAKDENARNIYKKLLTYFLYVLLFMFLIISILAQDIIQLIATPEFGAAYRVVPFIVLSQIFYGVYFMTAVGVNIKRKTQYLPFVVGFAALTNLILNYVLIPHHGMIGAAYASLFSYFILVILSTRLSLHYYSIKYEYVRIFKLALITATIYVLSIFIKTDNVIFSISGKSLLICSYPLLLYVVKFYHKKELYSFKEILKSKSILKEKMAFNKYEEDITG